MSSFLLNPLVVKKLSEHFGVSEESILGAKNLGVESFNQIFELDLLVKVKAWLDDLKDLSEPEDKKKLTSHKSYKAFFYLYKEIAQLNEELKERSDGSSDFQEISQYVATKGSLYKLVINNDVYNHLEYNYHGPFGHGIIVDETDEIYNIIDFMTTDLAVAHNAYEEGFYKAEFKEEEYSYWRKLFDIFNFKEVQ